MSHRLSHCSINSCITSNANLPTMISHVQTRICSEVQTINSQANYLFSLSFSGYCKSDSQDNLELGCGKVWSWEIGAEKSEFAALASLATQTWISQLRSPNSRFPSSQLEILLRMTFPKPKNQSKNEPRYSASSLENPYLSRKSLERIFWI